MNIKPGALVYDKASGRYNIRSGLNEYYGGLHCGQGFEVFDGEQWRATRIEMNLHQKWYWNRAYIYSRATVSKSICR